MTTTDKCRCWKPTEPQLDCPLHRHEARRPLTRTERAALWLLARVARLAVAWHEAGLR